MQARPRGFRFSDAFLRKLKLPPGKREAIQFEAGTGLGIRVLKSGQISFIGQLPLKDGTRFRWTIGAYGKLTIEAARDAVQALAGDIAKGMDPRQKRAEVEAAAKREAEAAEAKKFTLRALVERWKRDSLSTRRPGYAVRAAANVERTFKGLLDVPAAALARPDVRNALEAKRTQKTKRSSGRGSRVEGGPAAVRNAAASLRAAYRWALSEELLDADPLNGLKLPARTADRDRVLTVDEARRIYAAACALPYPTGHFVRLLMLTGMRRSEAAGLRWDEIATEGEGGAKAIELPPARTKTGAGHHVPLSGTALEVIAECTRHRIVGSPYVLTSDGWRSFGNYARAKTGLDQALDGDIADWRLHDFRRTIVSTLARKPFRYNPVMLDLLLGHQPAQLSPVARIYQQEEHHDDRREALEAWAKHLTQPPATVSDLQQERQRGGLR
jgi:integrase